MSYFWYYQSSSVLKSGKKIQVVIEIYISCTVARYNGMLVQSISIILHLHFYHANFFVSSDSPDINEIKAMVTSSLPA